MLIHWNGRDWLYDESHVEVGDAITVKRETGLRWPAELVQALTEADPEAIQAMMWLVRRQNGVDEPISAVTGSLLDFVEALGSAYEAEAGRRERAGEAEGNPQPAGDAPSDPLPTTSENSAPAI